MTGVQTCALPILDKTVQKFYKLGLLTLPAFNQYMGQILSDDKRIKAILMSLNIDRAVSTYDRSNYKIWTQEWKISDELLDYAITLAKGKNNPIKYLSRVLADYRDKGIKTIDEAKNNLPVKEEQASGGSFNERKYSKNEINALFQSIEEIDV